MILCVKNERVFTFFFDSRAKILTRAGENLLKNIFLSGSAVTSRYTRRVPEYVIAAIV